MNIPKQEVYSNGCLEYTFQRLFPNDLVSNFFDFLVYFSPTHLVWSLLRLLFPAATAVRSTLAEKSNLIWKLESLLIEKNNNKEKAVFAQNKDIPNSHIASSSPGKRRCYQIQTSILEFEKKMGEGMALMTAKWCLTFPIQWSKDFFWRKHCRKVHFSGPIFRISELTPFFPAKTVKSTYLSIIVDKKISSLDARSWRDVFTQKFQVPKVLQEHFLIKLLLKRLQLLPLSSGKVNSHILECHGSLEHQTQSFCIALFPNRSWGFREVLRI